MSLPWALGAPFTGLLSDRAGGGRSSSWHWRALALSTIGAVFATSFGMLLVARFAAGFFGAFGPASVMAVVGDLFLPHRRGMAMGWANAGSRPGGGGRVRTVGVIGGVFGWRWAFAATGLALVVLAVALAVGIPGNQACPTKQQPRTKRTPLCWACRC